MTQRDGEPTVKQAYFLHVSVPPLALTGLNLELSAYPVFVQQSGAACIRDMLTL